MKLGPRLAKELSPEPGSDPVGLAKIIPLEDEGAEGGSQPRSSDREQEGEEEEPLRGSPWAGASMPPGLILPN